SSASTPRRAPMRASSRCASSSTTRRRSRRSPTSRSTSPSTRSADPGALSIAPPCSNAMLPAIPLAWLQLTREKLRLLVAVAGVAFAVILIFMQLGFRNALFESSTRLHEALDGDRFLISPQFDFVAQPKNFSRRRLLQGGSFSGVQAVSPVYLGLLPWKN